MSKWGSQVETRVISFITLILPVKWVRYLPTVLVTNGGGSEGEEEEFWRRFVRVFSQGSRALELLP